MHAIPLVLALITTPAPADVAGVASVIDGDTIEVHGQPIRLHEIDAIICGPG
jgi:endonuclease YncB( thermonuclease family)